MYLYGASGHGKVIKEIVESQGKTVKGFVDDNIHINEMAGIPVKHSLDEVDEVIVSIGMNKTRKAVAEITLHGAKSSNWMYGMLTIFLCGWT